MPEREKVIKGVHDARRYLEDREWVDKSVGVHIDALNDALALLKEQEAIKPITEHKLFLCPVCKNTLFRGQKFCHECGKRIEWEGR